MSIYSAGKIESYKAHVCAIANKTMQSVTLSEG